jgi:hypothetical protein
MVRRESLEWYSLTGDRERCRFQSAEDETSLGNIRAKSCFCAFCGEWFRLGRLEKAAYSEAIWFHHQIFLGERSDLDSIVEAMQKVLKNIENLRGLDHRQFATSGSRASREN